MVPQRPLGSDSVVDGREIPERLLDDFSSAPIEKVEVVRDGGQGVEPLLDFGVLLLPVQKLGDLPGRKGDLLALLSQGFFHCAHR